MICSKKTPLQVQQVVNLELVEGGWINSTREVVSSAWKDTVMLPVMSRTLQMPYKKVFMEF